MNIRLRKLNELKDKWADFSDEYFIGDDGNIYRQLKSGYYRSKEHPYQQVRQSFGTNGKHTVKIHEAVAMAFIPKPITATDVDHINNDKTDNRAVNLQWLSHRDNLLKKVEDKERGAKQ